MTRTGRLAVVVLVAVGMVAPPSPAEAFHDAPSTSWRPIHRAPTRYAVSSSDNAAATAIRGRQARFGGRSTSSINVANAAAERPLESYLKLPASEYSTNILNTRSVERIDAETFRCTLDGLNLFGNRVEPVIVARVDVDTEAGGCTISLVSASIQGSPMVEESLKAFAVTSTNKVTWTDAQPGSRRMICDARIDVVTKVPELLPIPNELLESTLNVLFQQSLDRLVPLFLTTLRSDYQAWARDDPNRKKWVS